MEEIETTKITVFTGYLGSGKTSIILDLIKRKKHQEIICFVKNEFGDNQIDSELVEILKERMNEKLEIEIPNKRKNDMSDNPNPKGNYKITEFINGCICCTLLGPLTESILELKKQINPNRIIIETSGSALPFPIALQVNQLKDHGFLLESVINVIDCVNFPGYQDTSFTAKLQAQYTDLLLLTKHELVNERQLDLIIDLVNDLNTDTPRIKWRMGFTPIDLIFGLESQVFADIDSLPQASKQFHSADSEIDIIQIIAPPVSDTIDSFETSFLEKIDHSIAFRIKGILVFENRVEILNWAFGRWTWTSARNNQTDITRLTVMGIDLELCLVKFQTYFGVENVKLSKRFS